jgi:hypothetical protein
VDQHPHRATGRVRGGPGRRTGRLVRVRRLGAAPHGMGHAHVPHARGRVLGATRSDRAHALPVLHQRLPAQRGADVHVAGRAPFGRARQPRSSVRLLGGVGTAFLAPVGVRRSGAVICEPVPAAPVVAQQMAVPYVDLVLAGSSWPRLPPAGPIAGLVQGGSAPQRQHDWSAST